MSLNQRQVGISPNTGIGLAPVVQQERPNIASAIQASNNMNVRIEHGANDIEMAVAGFPVSKVKRAVAQTLNIPEDAIAFVNGQQVDETHILQQADRLEFLKESGRKGCKSFIYKDLC